MKIESANGKWWYRLFKVLFIFLFSVSLVTSSTASFVTYKPKLNTYDSKYGIKCSSGIIKGDFGSDILNGDSKNFYVPTNFAKYSSHPEELERLDTMSRLACKYDKFEVKKYVEYLLNGKYSIPAEINYEIVITKPVYYGSWIEAIGYTLLSLISSIAFYSLIRAIFLYIFFDLSFFKTFFWRQ